MSSNHADESNGSHPSATNRWPSADDATHVDRSEQYANHGRAVATMSALRSGRDAPQLNDDTAAALGEYLTNQSTRSAMRSRIQQASMAGIRGMHGPGRSHNGDRDYWRTFGYPEPGTVSPEEYELRAQRQDIAKIVAEAPVSATWKHPPIVRDDGREEGAEPTQFEQDVQTLLDGSISALSGSTERAGMGVYWEWADRKQRPTQYGLLLHGYDDGREMSQPVNASALSGPDDLAYCNAFSQADVTNWALAGDFDRGEPIRDGVARPDKPVLYEIKFEQTNPDGSVEYDRRIVHFSRIRHIVEKPTISEYIGESCLEALLHRLIDFEKVHGASAEAHYANVDRKYIGMGKEGGTLGGDREELIERFDEQMRQLTDEMRTTAYGENMDIEVIGGESVDPSGMLNSLYSPVAGVSNQPQRIMKGTERGDLASSQDESHWYSYISERQEQFNEPRQVRPDIEDWIRFGIVAAPEHPENSFSVVWRDLFELTELEKSEMAEQRSNALKAAEDAIAMGANRQNAYQYVNIPLPDSTSDTGSGAGPGSSVPDTAANLDESDGEVMDQFQNMTNGSETDTTLPAVADGGRDE